MTDSGPLITLFPNALPVFVLPLIENRFGARVSLSISLNLSEKARMLRIVHRDEWLEGIWGVAAK
jgi:hypothetical protein